MLVTLRVPPAPEGALGPRPDPKGKGRPAGAEQDEIKRQPCVAEVLLQVGSALI